PEPEEPVLVVPDDPVAAEPESGLGGLVAAEVESPVAAEPSADGVSPGAAVAGALKGLRRRPARSRTAGTLVSIVICAFSAVPVPVPAPVAGAAGSAAVEAGSPPPRPRTTGTAASATASTSATGQRRRSTR